ncbi:MAG: hypothetical protein JW931_00940 [Methanomicrobiaceae archaeon]|nr:hypothetical protein [Methanomicrobiaceae archaeon]
MKKLLPMCPDKLSTYRPLLFSLIVILCIVTSTCGCISNNDFRTDNYFPDNTSVQSDTGAVSSAEDASTEIKLPEIIPAEISGDHYDDRTFSVKFEKSEYELVLPVNLSVYYGAKNADKAITPGTLWNETDKVSAYYRSFFEGEPIDTFYDDILKKIRHIKIAEGFSDEEYLEFMVTFVQQIPYDPDAGHPRFPVEVVYDMEGDCDEKSMLLIGMLAREDYDTALIIFPEYRHATAGIRIITAGDTFFRQFKSEDGRKYVFIESTALSFIGQYPEYYEDAYAVVVPVGDGKNSFERYNYISYITESLNKITDRIIFLDSELDRLYSEIKELESDLNTKTYESRHDWEMDYLDYKALVDQYYEYEDILNRNIEVYNYIIEHPYDVEGVRRYIYNSKVNDIEY